MDRKGQGLARRRVPVRASCLNPGLEWVEPKDLPICQDTQEGEAANGLEGLEPSGPGKVPWEAWVMTGELGHDVSTLLVLIPSWILHLSSEHC